MSEVNLGDLPPFYYVGRLGCVSGYGEASRHQMWVLRSNGLRLQPAEVEPAAPIDPTYADMDFVNHCRAKGHMPRPEGTIFHLNPTCAESRRRSWPRPHIISCVWETTRLPAEWVRLLNTYEQVWCPTRWQMRVFKASGVEEGRLKLVTFALDGCWYIDAVKEPSVQRHKDEGLFVFGSIFQWSERKAPRQLIAAYLRAFTGRDRVVLIIKTYKGDVPGAGNVDALVFAEVEAQVRRIKELEPSYEPPRITVNACHLQRREMLGFYRDIDYLVQATRGEGWGLPIHEALMMGTEVAATDWSAPPEYADGLIDLIPCSSEPVHSMEQPIYTPDQSWACPHFTELARLMYTQWHWMTVRQEEFPSVSAPRRRERLQALVAKAAGQAYAALQELS